MQQQRRAARIVVGGGRDKSARDRLPPQLPSPVPRTPRHAKHTLSACSTVALSLRTTMCCFSQMSCSLVSSSRALNLEEDFLPPPLLPLRRADVRELPMLLLLIAEAAALLL